MEEKKSGKSFLIILVLAVLVVLAGAATYAVYIVFSARGYEDYTVQMQQYYVEYSDEYDYWDVLTIEYPQIEGIDEEQAAIINQMMYDTAFDRSNYWHFEPNEEVKKLQEEHYDIFSSDVACEVSYHSQYLVSLKYEEVYAPASPVYYVSMTNRGLNVDLMTGEQYRLTDIVRMDEEFIKFWMEKANEEYDDFFSGDEEVEEILLDWFLKTNEEWNEYYEFQPYFYITEDKEFTIGIAVDPKYISAREPQMDAYEISCTVQELEAYKTESEFWEKYEKSESAGTVVECEELHNNLWLGEDASTWTYWEERGDLFSN